MPRIAEHRTIPRWAAVAAFWVCLAIVYASQVWWLSQRPGERIDVRSAMIWQGTYYLMWIPFTLLIWRATRPWSVEALGWPAFLVRHAGLALGVALAHTSLVVPAAALLSGEEVSVPDLVLTQFRVRLHMHLLIYGAIAGVGLALTMEQQSRDRAAAAARLEAQLADARLGALRAQLHPHFLFNSLHTIASLARAGDTAMVVRLVAGLGDLLRQMLSTDVTRLPLQDELRLVDHYLDIQQVRFGDRLTVSRTVAPEAAGALVPPILVQPLVENALRHGLAPLPGRAHLHIDAARDGDALLLCVEDSGVGLPDGWSLAGTTGTGLRNLNARLAGEFGPRHSLVIEPRSGGGVRALVRIPFEASAR